MTKPFAPFFPPSSLSTSAIFTSVFSLLPLFTSSNR